MIKQEEIKLETEAMEFDQGEQYSTNSGHITTEELVKIEPESFLGTEEFSNPVQAKATVSKSVRKKRKNVANERQKLAEKMEKRQAKRAKNPDRHKENIAQLPDYRELSQTHNQEPSDTNLNNNAVDLSEEIQRNVTEVSNIEAKLSSGMFSNNVLSHYDSNGMERENDTDINIGDGQESNTGDAEARNMRLLDCSIAGETNQKADLTSIDETRKPETVIEIENCKELDSVSSIDICSEANPCDAEAQILHAPDTSMASDTNQTVHSTIGNSVQTESKTKLVLESATQANTLKKHIRTHTGEKPYKCSQCLFAGASSGDLKTHMRTHSGEKPYKCSQCFFAAARAYDLKKHIRTHV